MKLTTGSTAPIRQAWPVLPLNVPVNYFRFFCRVLRTDAFENTITLEVYEAEITLPSSAVKVGLSDGKLCCDIKEVFAHSNSLV